jgi:hypothetical protein
VFSTQPNLVLETDSHDDNPESRSSFREVCFAFLSR